MSKARSVKTSAAVRLSAQDKKWRAQDDLRTLQQVMQIKSDPGRLKAAQTEAQQQLKALEKVKGV